MMRPSCFFPLQFINQPIVCSPLIRTPPLKKLKWKLKHHGVQVGARRKCKIDTHSSNNSIGILCGLGKYTCCEMFDRRFDFLNQYWILVLFLGSETPPQPQVFWLTLIQKVTTEDIRLMSHGNCAQLKEWVQRTLEFHHFKSRALFARTAHHHFTSHPQCPELFNIFPKIEPLQ